MVETAEHKFPESSQKSHAFCWLMVPTPYSVTEQGGLWLRAEKFAHCLLRLGRGSLALTVSNGEDRLSRSDGRDLRALALDAEGHEGSGVLSRRGGRNLRSLHSWC